MSSFNFKTTKWHTKIAETERIEARKEICVQWMIQKNGEKKNH